MPRLLLPATARCRVAAVVSAVAAFAVLLIPATAHAAATALCTPSDSRLTDISGLVSTPDGYAVVHGDGTAAEVFFLDSTCSVSKVLRDRGINPFDPQDLGRTPDGSLWIADVGDVNRERSTISVHKFTRGGTPATKYRMTYPDGKFDAAALIMQRDGTPVVVTKDPLKPAGVYVPDGPLSSSGTTPLRKVGSLAFQATGTPGGTAGRVSQTVVTGGAISPDGTRAVLRTYTDAYEYTIAGGDVATSLVRAKPLRTPLPGESQGEAITYTPDGKSFVTVSKGEGMALQRWQRVVPAPSASPSASGANAAPAKAPGSGGLFGGLSLLDLQRLIGGIGLLGLVFLVAGIVGIVRHRRRLAAAAAAVTGSASRSASANGFAGPGPRGAGAAPGSAAGAMGADTVVLPRVTDAGGPQRGGAAPLDDDTRALHRDTAGPGTTRRGREARRAAGPAGEPRNGPARDGAPRHPARDITPGRSRDVPPWDGSPR